MKSTFLSALFFIFTATVASAATIASGEVKTGTLKFGETETWTISLVAQQPVRLGLGGLSSTNERLFVQGRIIDPFGLPVSGLRADATANTPGGFVPVYTGTYSIVLECGRTTSLGLSVDDSFTYRLEVIIPKAGSFSVSNGDDGGALTNGASYDGIVVNGDLDPWTFSATAGEFYIIDVTSVPEPGAPIDPILSRLLSVAVFNPDGSVGRTTNSGGFGTLTWTENSGLHTAVVIGGYVRGQQRYRIRKITVPSVFQVSPGEQGGPLTDGVTHQGTIGYFNVDVWTLPASSGDTITVRMNKTSGVTFVPDLTIYSPIEGRIAGSGFGELVTTFRPTFNGLHTFIVRSRIYADSGSYTLSVSGATSPAPPAIVTQPASQNVVQGATISLTVAASGAGPLTYQWRRDGTVLAGATSATLSIPGAQAANAGTYAVVVSNGIGSVTSNPANVTVAPAIASRISNVSVRTTLAASQTLIVGLSMSGGSKSALVRAIGPGLAAFGVAGTMPDPRLALFEGATQVEVNDNWGGAAALASAAVSVGAFALPAASLDAVVLRPIDGTRTAQVSGAVGGTVLVEAYDAGMGNSPRLVNISARNRVGTGGDILIAGFTISGTGSKTVLIRAVGPTLASFGVSGALADPKLELYSGTTKVNENDTWAASLAPTFSSVGAFPLTAGSRDAALVATLSAGSYTVQISGADGGTGEALVEIYEVQP